MNRRKFCLSSFATAISGAAVGSGCVRAGDDVIHPGTNALTVKYQGVKSGVLLEWKDLPAELVPHLARNTPTR